MGMDFLPDKPIYQQIIESIIGNIISGTLSPGDKLPSVRDYAVQVGVNANTMQRVFKELEQMEVTETKRGQGSFVTENVQQIEYLRQQVKEDLANSFLQSIETYGIDINEMIEDLRKRSARSD
mgnify:FL=1